MARSRPILLGELVMRARERLGMTQRAFGKHLGVSERTAIRWRTGKTKPPGSVLRTLAGEIAVRDADLASALASAGGFALEAQVAKPTTTLAAATDARADAIVCAAADALNVAPQNARVAIVAAIARARSLGVHVDEIAALLGA